MDTRLKKPRLDLNLRQVPKHLRDDINRIFGREVGRMLLDHIEEIRYLFTKIEPDLEQVIISIEGHVIRPYQKLVVSDSNCIDYTLNGVTARGLVTTTSQTAKEFKWANPNRISKVVVGPGDGVEPHLFLVNPEYNQGASRWVYDGAGNWVSRARDRIVIPASPPNQDTKLVFGRFTENTGAKDNTVFIPVDMANGTTIKLQQWLSYEEINN